MRLIFRLREGNKSKGRWKTDPHFRSDKPLFSNLAPEEATARPGGAPQKTEEKEDEEDARV